MVDIDIDVYIYHIARFTAVPTAAGCPFCFSFQASPANQA